MAVVDRIFEIALADGDDKVKKELINRLLSDLNTDELAKLQIACGVVRKLSGQAWKVARMKKYRAVIW